MPSTYWVRYQAEDAAGRYAVRVGKAGTLIALAAQINEILDNGWTIDGLGATSPRELATKERSVIAALTHGRLPEMDPDT